VQLTAENQERLAVDDELGRTLLFAQIGRQLAVAVLRWFSHLSSASIVQRAFRLHGIRLRH